MSLELEAVYCGGHFHVFYQVSGFVRCYPRATNTNEIFTQMQSIYQLPESHKSYPRAESQEPKV